MTFLELCNATALDSGLISSQNLMTDVTSASAFYTGRYRNIIDAVIAAWKTIQAGRPDWAWMQGTYTNPLVIGQSSYTPAQLGIAARFRSFLPDRDAECFRPHTLYDGAIGRSDETELCQITPMLWRRMYDRGVQTNSRPIYYALEAGKLLLGPLPDKTYTLRGLYMKSPQILANNADLPELPDTFHEVIKWRAILDLHGRDGAFADRSVAQAEYSRLYRLLANEQTAPLSLGNALA